VPEEHEEKPVALEVRAANAAVFARDRQVEIGRRLAGSQGV